MFSDFRINLSRKVTPFKRPEILYSDKLEISLQTPAINQVKVDTFDLPITTDNYCFINPKINKVDYAFGSVKNFDVKKNTFVFFEALIESIFEPLRTKRVAGKVYGEEESKKKVKQKSLFSDFRCIHGLKEGACSICQEKKEKREKKKKTEPFIDIFDLIYPILLPPLKLSSLIVLLPGKELRPFQIKGVKFLCKSESALLGDEMGLGKTVQTIMALKVLFHNAEIMSCIIICPKAVLGSWIKHFEEWAPELRILRVRGQRNLRRMKWTYPSHIYITTYETLRQDIENIDVEKYDVCVLDEIQKIKNPNAQVTKSVRKINSKIRWGLSGTPLENRVEELISILQYLKPGLLRYEDASYAGLIKKKIKPYFLRRRKTDVLKELPEKVSNPEWISLTPTQQEAYDRAEQEGVVALNEQGEKITVHHILALITKLKQICNYDVVSGESAKLNTLKEKLESIKDQGDKALIFSQFPQKTLKFIKPHLKKYEPLLYHGGLSERQRDALVDQFNEEEKNKIFLMSVRAAGLGINLQRANYVFHFDQWWNPATSSQAEDRTHRIGQKKTVFVTTIQTLGTIEERIHELLERKKALFNEIVDDLSDTDLRKVLIEEDLFGLFNLTKTKPKSDDRTIDQKVSIANLKKLSPRELENIVAELYEAMGYIVNETSYSRDEGVDIYAKKITDSGIEQLAIQCKHYPEGSVGVQLVRELYGVITHKQDVTRGIVVTSGRFSSEARAFSKNKRLSLYDGKYLLGLLSKYNIQPQNS